MKQYVVLVSIFVMISINALEIKCTGRSSDIEIFVDGTFNTEEGLISLDGRSIFNRPTDGETFKIKRIFRSKEYIYRLAEYESIDSFYCKYYLSIPKDGFEQVPLNNLKVEFSFSQIEETSLTNIPLFCDIKR